MLTLVSFLSVPNRGQRMNVSFSSLRSKRFRGVWKQRKTRNGIFGVFSARKMGREPKMKDGGRGGEGRKRLQTNPWILKISVRQRTELVIGWTSRILLTCVYQRS